MTEQIRNICNNKCVDFVVRMVVTDDEDLQPTGAYIKLNNGDSNTIDLDKNVITVKQAVIRQFTDTVDIQGVVAYFTGKALRRVENNSLDFTPYNRHCMRYGEYESRYNSEKDKLLQSNICEYFNDFADNISDLLLILCDDGAYVTADGGNTVAFINHDLFGE